MYIIVSKWEKYPQEVIFLENIGKRILIITILVISIAISLILVTLGFAFGEHQPKSKMWILQSYGNNVALYNGDEVIEVYGAIMLDTLPEEDKRQLDNGISFLTKEEARSAIEDYDG